MMKEKMKIIIVVGIATISVAVGTKFIVLKNKEKFEKTTYPDTEQNEKTTDIENKKDDTFLDDNDEINNDIDEEQVSLEAETSNKLVSVTTSNKKSNNYVQNIENNKKPISGTSTKPIKPTNPGQATNPEKPVNPNPPIEEATDLVITNDMISNGVYKTENKKYRTLTISDDIQDNTRIILDVIEVEEGLILENPTKYQLDILNSNISTMLVTNQKTKSLSRFLKATVYKAMNKALEGATVNFDQNSTVKSISVNSNVHINGNSAVSKIDVNNSTEVVLNIPSEKLILNTSGVVAINQNVTNLMNNSKATIVINAPVKTLTNNEESAIRITKGNTITNFSNNAENTIVSGNGNITNATIAANNTKIFTEVTNKRVNENIEYLLIRQEDKIKFINVQSNGQGKVTFTLSEAVDLDIKDISVICSAGKNITLYNLTTKDKKTYTLSTSYFKNNSYALYITLPNGNIISQEFDTDYANPTVENVVIERNSNTDATLKLYGVDEGGSIYYLLKDESRSNIDIQTIKNEGKNANVKVGFNSISLTDLEPGKIYNLYYVLEGYYDNVSKVEGPIEIPGTVKVEQESKYEIVYAKEEISNRFVFKLNRIPEKILSLDDFEIECPSNSNLTIKNATFYVSPDLLTYIIVIPDNYGHKDNEYTVKINVSETEKIEKKFATHINPPTISGETTTRVDEDTVELNFNSDEAGKVYYGVYEWNGGIYDYNSTTPFASDVITGRISSQTQVLHAQSNTIRIDLSNIQVTNYTRIWVLYVDEVGNYRVGFVDHYKIPEYTEIVEPEGTLKITNITYNNSSINVQFNEDTYITEKDVSMKVIKDGNLPTRLSLTINNTNSRNISISFNGFTLTKGEYELTLSLEDKNGTPVKLVEKLIIN